MSNLAVIPARGGSKRIPRKNIKSFLGKPIMAYSIEAALESGLFDEVMVSTDDKEIAEVAKSANAEIPFIRPSEFAEDTTPDRPVLIHFLEWYFNKEGKYPALIVFLRPTSPLRKIDDLKKAIHRIKSNYLFSGLRSINKVEGIHHPFWMYKKDDEILKPFIDNIDITKYYQKQLLPDCYRLNGAIDILKPEVILNNKYIYGNRVTYIEIDERLSIDIDTKFDFELCEFMMKKN